LSLWPRLESSSRKVECRQDFMSGSQVHNRHIRSCSIRQKSFLGTCEFPLFSSLIPRSPKHGKGKGIKGSLPNHFQVIIPLSLLVRRWFASLHIISQDATASNRSTVPLLSITIVLAQTAKLDLTMPVRAGLVPVLLNQLRLPSFQVNLYPAPFHRVHQ
jgi:hypothetical protein